MSDPALVPWSSEKIEAAEKYLDRMLAKMESAKADVEKNWLGQITSIAISLALVAGLGTAVATKLLADPQRHNILYVVFPIVNTYFFVRFGLLAGVFSKARYNSECLARELAPRRNLPEGFDVSQIYKTNSYFEWAHHPFNKATVLFLLTIPVIFALNHSLTLYLTYKVLGLSPAFYAIATLYVAVVAICYGAYYFSNRHNTVVFSRRGRNPFIMLVIVIAMIGTAVMIWGLGSFDPDPRPIEFDMNSPAETPAADAP